MCTNLDRFCIYRVSKLDNKHDIKGETDELSWQILALKLGINSPELQKNV